MTKSARDHLNASNIHCGHPHINVWQGRNKFTSFLHKLQGFFSFDYGWEYAIAGSITIPFSFLTVMILSLIPGRTSAIWWVIIIIFAFLTSIIICDMVWSGLQRCITPGLAYVVTGCYVLVIITFSFISTVATGSIDLVLPGILLFVGTGTIWNYFNSSWLSWS